MCVVQFTVYMCLHKSSTIRSYSISLNLTKIRWAEIFGLKMSFFTLFRVVIQLKMVNTVGLRKHSLTDNLSLGCLVPGGVLIFKTLPRTCSLLQGMDIFFKVFFCCLSIIPSLQHFMITFPNNPYVSGDGTTHET